MINYRPVTAICNSSKASEVVLHKGIYTNTYVFDSYDSVRGADYEHPSSDTNESSNELENEELPLTLTVQSDSDEEDNLVWSQVETITFSPNKSNRLPGFSMYWSSKLSLGIIRR